MPYQGAAPEQELAVSDEEILRDLKAERERAIGFDGDDELSQERSLALEYSRGEMKDLPAPANRSKVVSSDVANAIETVLPDLMEILAGGEDVGTFKPDGPDDEEQSRQETDAVNEVIFEQNPGFLTLYSAIKDGLQTKIALARVWWQDYDYETEKFTGKTAGEVEAAMQSSEIEDLAPDGVGADQEPLYRFTARKMATAGCTKIAAVEPANFAVAPDTVTLPKCAYCVERSFPRAFELTDQGFDPELVGQLEGKSTSGNSEIGARDTVHESDESMDNLPNGRRTVEVHTHTIRADYDGSGKTSLWEIVTDADEKLIMKKKRVNRVGYAAGKPFITSHRFYGESLADKLIEVQRIKTQLTRILLDAGYFAQNGRHQVSTTEGDENTLSDLLRNEPGYPVRSKTGAAIKPFPQAVLGFDVLSALEYMATVGEERSGVVRNAQGLNPDTLHDTAGGMEKLFSAAQRRVRMIARVFAETLLHDLFLLVHGTMRDHATHSQQMRLGSKWVAIDPTSWGARNNMTVEVGVGSGGKEFELAAINQIIGMQMKAVEAQAAGLIKVPLVTEKHLYASAKRLTERLGMKMPELYFEDPAAAAEQAAINPQPPQPDPAAMQAQAEMQLEAEKTKAQLQLQQQKQQAELQTMREKAKLEGQIMREKHAAEIEVQRERMAAEHDLALQKMALEAQLAQQKAQLEARLGLATAQNGMSEYRLGGDLSR